MSRGKLIKTATLVVLLLFGAGEYPLHANELEKDESRILSELGDSAVFIRALKHIKPGYAELREEGYGLIGAMFRYVSLRLAVSYNVGNVGTGFIVGKNGTVLTAYHVVEHADKVMITSQGMDWKAEVFGFDKESDVAMVRIDPFFKHKSLEIGDSDSIKPGDKVFALGNPTGIGAKIISGQTGGQIGETVGVLEYEKFIETDFEVEPPFSGGPLLDSRGRVIGINSVKASKGGKGFAIPINIPIAALEVFANLRVVKRDKFGVETEQLEKGLSAKAVLPDSIAGKAGILPGDIIKRVNNRRIYNMAQLKTVVLSLPGQKTAEIEVNRNGETLRLSTDITPVYYRE